jgi:hypothetical protein
VAFDDELYEEVSYSGTEPLDPLGSRTIVVDHKGNQTKLLERWFVLRTVTLKVDMSRLGESERLVTEGYYWWTAEELEECSDVLVPRDLPRLVRRILSGEALDGTWDLGE